MGHAPRLASLVLAVASTAQGAVQLSARARAQLRSKPGSAVARPTFSTLPSAAIVVIDTDNVRGKTAFAMSHEGLVARTALWAAAHHKRGRVMLALDHGAATQGFDSERLGLSLGFAGPDQTADALIVRWVTAVASCDSSPPVMLVTADSGLALRCRRAASGRQLSVCKPQFFLESLAGADAVPRAARPLSPAVARAAAELGETSDWAAVLEAVEREMACRAAVLRSERSLARCGRAKKRKDNVRQLKELRLELERATGASRALVSATECRTVGGAPSVVCT